MDSCVGRVFMKANVHMLVGEDEHCVSGAWAQHRCACLQVDVGSAVLSQCRLDSPPPTSSAVVCHGLVPTAWMSSLCWTMGRSQWSTASTFLATPTWPSPSTLTIQWKVITCLPCGQRRKPKQSMPSCAPSWKTRKARGPPTSALP